MNRPTSMPPILHKSKKRQTLLIDLRREASVEWKQKQVLRALKGKPKSAMPTEVPPMLATLTPEAFDDQDWTFEIKWDGYRTLAICNGEKTVLRSRNNKSFNDKFNPLLRTLKEWPVSAVLDGEVVVLNSEGKSDFGVLQNYEPGSDCQLVYFVFDLLWLEGYNLCNEPLHIRRQLLAQLLPDSGDIRFNDAVEECGKDFFKVAKENKLEGIIAKRKDSTYQPGSRSTDWFKIKNEERQEAVICGYTKKKASSRLFSSLVLGVPHGKGFRYIGQVGTGFTGALQRKLFKQMNPLFTTASPFEKKPPLNAPVQWLKPQLLCEVKYTELTSEGVMRHPSFQGIRTDKSVKEFNADVPPKNKPKKEGITFPIQLTNLQKTYWPGDGITKGDLIHYYETVSPFILPYLKDRPHSLLRHPEGIKGESFYQKHIRGNVPAFLQTYRHQSSSGSDDVRYLVCSDETSLLYMANLGCIEMHPWHSRIQSPLKPDWCVIDLDPGKASFDKVVEAALVFRDILKSAKIPSYPKTSGSTGLHIYIPLGAKYSYGQSRHLAELLCTLVENELPHFTTTIRSTKLRDNKMYLDYLQNREGQTICAPYSVRAKKGATVSAPLYWEEVKQGLQLTQFTMTNMLARIKAEGDPFTGVLERGIDLKKALGSLSTLTNKIMQSTKQ